MSSIYYSPNSSNTGGLLNVSFNSKDGHAYLKFVKQTSWDASARKASFKGGETIGFKLSPDEIGQLMYCIRRQESHGFFHNFNGGSVTGNFKYYEIAAQGDKPIKKGFGFSIKKATLEIKIGIALGAAERLYEYLRFALDRINNADYAKDKKEFETAQKAKGIDIEKTKVIEDVDSEPVVNSEESF